MKDSERVGSSLSKSADVPPDYPGPPSQQQALSSQPRILLLACRRCGFLSERLPDRKREVRDPSRRGRIIGAAREGSPSPRSPSPL
jgi:hypothetical protein